MTLTVGSKNLHIREVWASNLEQEFKLIRDIVDDFPYVAMDTEYPGVVIKPIEEFGRSTEFRYHIMRANVNMLHLIQMGLTFSDENGNLPQCGTSKFCVWQFNFKEFNLRRDIYAADSIELLKQSGIKFEEHYKHGVEANAFAELLMSSGAVLHDQVTWVTFHSGYDFAYLLKMLTGRDLPPQEYEFFNLMRIFFPVFYDIKYVMRFANNLYGGLNRVAEKLEVSRVGPQHQAGSDSLLTSSTFHKMKETMRKQGKFLPRYGGVLYGLGMDYADIPGIPLPR